MIFMIIRSGGAGAGNSIESKSRALNLVSLLNGLYCNHLNQRIQKREATVKSLKIELLSSNIE